VKKKMILDPCGPESGFFIHIDEEKNDIAHLWVCKRSFFQIGEKQNGMHTCEPISVFFSHIRGKK
jgi:hypothetical protein